MRTRKISKMPEPEQEEHPDDRALRQSAEVAAEKAIGPFWRKHWKEFVALVQVYADAKAQSQLEALREKFWGLNCEQGEPPQGAS